MRTQMFRSADCWACGRLVAEGRPHADWCWLDPAEDEGRYLTDDPARWPKDEKER